MGVVVKQEDRGQSVQGPTFFKALSEIGPTTYEAGKDPHVEGVPVAELLSEMSEKAEAHDVAEKSARAKARAKPATPAAAPAAAKPEAKAPDAK